MEQNRQQGVFDFLWKRGLSCQLKLKVSPSVADKLPSFGTRVPGILGPHTCVWPQTGVLRFKVGQVSVRFATPACGQPERGIAPNAVFLPQRELKSLAEVARVSSAHTRAVAHLLARALHGDPAKAPRDIGALLELLSELLSETGGKLEDSRAREYIPALPFGGKTAKLGKQILSIRSADS